MLSFQLSRRRIVALLAVLGGVNILMLWATYLARVFWPAIDWWPAQFIGLQFNLSRENNPAVWYASMLLFAVALAMCACFAVDMQADRRRRDHLLSFGWLVVAGLFAALSLDEAGSLHERINHIARAIDLSEVLRVESPGWVGVLAIPIGLVGGLILLFGWFRMRYSTTALPLMVAGTLLFLSVPLQEHLEVKQLLEGGASQDDRPFGALLLEEGTELFGSLCFLAAALWYGYDRALQLGNRSDTGSAITFTVSADVAVAMTALLAASMLLVSIALPQVTNLDTSDGRGIPLNWFPSALAFLVAIASLAIAHRHRVLGQRIQRAYLVFGLVHVALSIDHASAHQFTELMLGTIPLTRLILDLVFTMVLIFAGIWLAVRTTWLPLKVGAVVWLAMLVPFWVGLPLRPALGLVAYSLILLALAAQAVAERERGSV